MPKRIVLLLLLVPVLGFVVTQAPTPYQFPVLEHFPKMPQNPANPATTEGVALGRFLFYDPILSQDRSVACAMCHFQAFAFADNVVFSEGINGTPTKRNSMPLFNLAWYNAMFWDGRAASIEQQILHPVRDPAEMALPWADAAKRINASSFYKPKFKAAFGNQKIDSVLIAKAIGQFLRTMISYQSKFDRVLAGKEFLNKSEYNGFVLMNDMTKADCLHCHTTDADPMGTTFKFSNNGLDTFSNVNYAVDKGLYNVTNNPADVGHFKIPSLRNVMVTAPYMHDGRFKTIDQVLDFYSTGVKRNATIDSKMEHAHKGGVNLTSQEKEDIKAFLHTLTDSVFITNPAFSNPFK